MDDVAVTELLSHETMETIVEKLASQFRDELKGKDEEVARFLKQISKDLGAKVRAFWRSPPSLDCTWSLSNSIWQPKGAGYRMLVNANA